MLLLRISILIVCISYFACLVFCSWIIWRLHYTGPCYFDTKQCFENYLTRTPDPLLKLWVYSSTSQSPNGSDLYPVWEFDDFNANESFTKDVTVRLPLRMHYNGTMFIHVFLSPPVEGGRGAGDPFDADWFVNETGIITHTSHQATTYQITNDSLLEKQELVAGDHLTSTVTTHWRPHLTLNAMTTDIGFASGQVPDALKAYFRPYKDQYLPMLIIDDIYFRSKDLLPLNNTCKEMPLKITYTPVSFVTIFLRTSVKGSINLRRPGDFSEEQIEMDKEDAINNVPGHILTLIIGFYFSLPCFLLSVLCDISFWQERRTMGGLSTHSVVWNSVSLAVLFLEVTNEVPLLNSDFYSVIFQVFVSFVATLEIWRMFKVFQPRISWTERRLVSDNADVGDKERETQEYDAQAMRCLSYVLYPAWVAVIIYTLQYNFQKSWYSLCIQSLANGFRYLGFLFVLPQVFINYKLKSVADLPWKALTFRALTSFAIDICHVISPSRGGKVSFPYEVFFVIYLYQRWLYSH